MTNPSTEALAEKCANLSEAIMSALKGASNNEGLIALMITLRMGLEDKSHGLPAADIPPQVTELINLLSDVSGMLLHGECLINSLKG
jgi:hypothetical protein